MGTIVSKPKNKIMYATPRPPNAPPNGPLPPTHWSKKNLNAVRTQPVWNNKMRGPLEHI